MKREYDTFVKSLQDIPEDTPIPLTIRDLTPGPEKYDSHYVKAVVASSPRAMPDGDVLWIRFHKGMHPKPWAIKVLEELGEYQVKPPEGW